MIARLYRPLLMGLLPLALIACMNSPPTSAEAGVGVPLGVDLGGSGPVIASPPPPAPAHEMPTQDGGSSGHRRKCRWRMRGTTTRMGPAP